MRGFGGIVSCDSNERHTPDVANPAEDLIAHSLAFHPLLYREGAIEHSAEKIAKHHTAADIHAPASHRSGSYPAPGFRLR